MTSLGPGMGLTKSLLLISIFYHQCIYAADASLYRYDVYTRQQGGEFQVRDRSIVVDNQLQATPNNQLEIPRSGKKNAPTERSFAQIRHCYANLYLGMYNREIARHCGKPDVTQLNKSRLEQYRYDKQKDQASFSWKSVGRDHWHYDFGNNEMLLSLIFEDGRLLSWENSSALH